MSSILDILNRLEETSSRNDKISILKSEHNNDLLRRVLDAALNPYRQFYIRQIPDYEHSSSTISLSIFLDHLADFENRVVTGNDARDVLAQLMSQLSQDDAEVARRIIIKDLRCGVQAATINKVWNNLIPTYPCLLGKAYNEKSIKAIEWPAMGQLKADGMRANVLCKNGTVSLRGRSGKHIDLLGHLVNEFEPFKDSNIVFDGELLLVDFNGNIVPREAGNGILNKAIRGTISESEAERVRIRLWDVIPYGEFQAGLCETPYFERFQSLGLFTEFDSSEKVSIIETRLLRSMKDAESYFEECLVNGEEGIMIKNSNSPWEDKRSKNLVKMKAEKDCDLKVIGWNKGQAGTKFENMLGSLVCASDDGTVEVAISGFSDDLRAHITKNIDGWIGRIVTVMYNQRIKDKNRKDVDSLFLPRFVELREDKNVADDGSKIV